MKRILCTTILASFVFAASANAIGPKGERAGARDADAKRVEEKNSDEMERACAAASGGESKKKEKKDPPKESGEKGGTEDMNIGIGELQECTSAEAEAEQKR